MQETSDISTMWVDADDWQARLRREIEEGRIAEDLRQPITDFGTNGYTIIKKCIPDRIVDRINSDLELFWRSPPNMLKIETWEPDGKIKIIEPVEAYRDGSTKLLDLYAFSSAARSAIAAPEIVRFLKAIFGENPKVFQSLSFYRGSQQPVHKDTAYVRILGSPTALAASWIALEDIREGSGELEYYVGSHRAKPYLFGGVSRWLMTDDKEYQDDHGDYLRSLHEQAHESGFRSGRFLARKGDVLIWHADLAHGGSAVTDRTATRKSLVAHYCPEACRPFYERATSKPWRFGRLSFVSQYSPMPKQNFWTRLLNAGG
jgi:phytanoyl-CoA hydroxylase